MVSVQRHVLLLRSTLGPAESEQGWVRAERVPAGHAGALLVTDRRLLFSGLGFLQQSQEAWPIALIDGAALTSGRPAHLDVRVPGGTERFAGKERDLAVVRDLLGAASTPPALSLSVAGELERLVALRDAGVLTDEELASAKARLLA